MKGNMSRRKSLEVPDKGDEELKTRLGKKALDVLKKAGARKIRENESCQ